MEITRPVPQEVSAPADTTAEKNPTKKAAKLPFTLAARLFLGVIATTPFLAGCNLPGNIPLPGQVRQSAEDCISPMYYDVFAVTPYMSGNPKGVRFYGDIGYSGYLSWADLATGENTITDKIVNSLASSHNHIAAATPGKDVFVIDTTNKKTTTLLDNASLEQDEFVRLLRFSPDGKILAIEIENYQTEITKMVFANTDGSQRVIVDTDASGHKLALNHDLAWSPDSQRIVLSNWMNTPKIVSDVYYANIVSEGQLIAKPAFQKAKIDPQDHIYLRWSADSQKVIFEQQKEVPFGKLRTMKMYPDGSDLKQVVPGCADDSAYPSPLINKTN